MFCDHMYCKSVLIVDMNRSRRRHRKTAVGATCEWFLKKSSKLNSKYQDKLAHIVKLSSVLSCLDINVAAFPEFDFQVTLPGEKFI